MECLDDAFKNVKLELEIDGQIVDVKAVYFNQLEFEIKKMRLRAMMQREPWAIYKTVFSANNKGSNQYQINIK